MKASTFNSKKYPSSYDQTPADIIKWPLLKSTYFHSHSSKFIKHLSYIILEFNTLLQLQKWWDANISDFCKYLSTNKILPPYKKLKSEHHLYISPPTRPTSLIFHSKRKL